jgi:adenylylsulfate kinase
MKILIMGLPGAGKTWLAERLQKHLPDCAWYNADKVREMANDWEFSEEARIRQARRMANIASYEKGCGRNVICDFVCPTELTRYIFEADITIWVNTIKEGRFEDTNKMFEEPKTVDFEIDKYLSEEDGEVEQLAQSIQALRIYDEETLTGC